ncbi:hypothetical protein ACOSQ3_000900 [Xanthoceras sorbifolium]
MARFIMGFFPLLAIIRSFIDVCLCWTILEVNEGPNMWQGFSDYLMRTIQGQLCPSRRFLMVFFPGLAIIGGFAMRVKKKSDYNSTCFPILLCSLLVLLC